jgi:hypothetical protein
LSINISPGIQQHLHYVSEAQTNARIGLSELDHVKSIGCTNHELTTENAALISRVEVLERDLATCDFMMTRYTARLEHLTARNVELNKSSENSLGETEKTQKAYKVGQASINARFLHSQRQTGLQDAVTSSVRLKP